MYIITHTKTIESHRIFQPSQNLNFYILHCVQIHIVHGVQIMIDLHSVNHQEHESRKCMAQCPMDPFQLHEIFFVQK